MKQTQNLANSALDGMPGLLHSAPQSPQKARVKDLFLDFFDPSRGHDLIHRRRQDSQRIGFAQRALRFLADPRMLRRGQCGIIFTPHRSLALRPNVREVVQQLGFFVRAQVFDGARGQSPMLLALTAHAGRHDVSRPLHQCVVGHAERYG
jgi:hypothetical protein